MLKKDSTIHKLNLSQLYETLTKVVQKHKKYKFTILVRQDESLVPVEIKIFAYFSIKSSIVKGITFEKESITIDKKMQDLEVELNPTQFFRVNRQFIVQRVAIKKINYAINGKLTLITIPKFNETVVVSKAKSKHFKEWMCRH